MTVYRKGGRKSVFPHTIRRMLAGCVRDADVVLEIINGITFVTPLWLRVPHVQYVHHVHREQYIEEMGLRGGWRPSWPRPRPCAGCTVAGAS